jgi:hypothetical protein
VLTGLGNLGVLRVSATVRAFSTGLQGQPCGRPPAALRPGNDTTVTRGVGLTHHTPENDNLKSELIRAHPLDFLSKGTSLSSGRRSAGSARLLPPPLSPGSRQVPVGPTPSKPASWGPLWVFLDVGVDHVGATCGP